MSKTKAGASGTVRRSFALPRQLIDAATRVAPSELRDNLNRLLRVALEEFVAHRRALDFENSMLQMAADPAIQAASKAISKEFESAESDGLQS